MQKDFDSWNSQKKKVHLTEGNVLFYEREVWWVKLGINVGSEIDGRHELFLRPVIIIRKFNKDMAIVLPTTTQDKTNKYYFDVLGVEGKIYKACLSQIKTISSKRLFRKIDTINKNDYSKLLNKICQTIKGTLETTKPPFGGISEAEAHNHIQ
jgi:mRNA interferase MazF